MRDEPEMNILFVENHGVFAATVIRQFLSQHSVTVVASLSAARRTLADAAFDLLLVDYDLDDGKGDELVKELQASGSAVKVVGVSSHDEGNTALLQAGAVTICSKTEFDRIQPSRKSPHRKECSASKQPPGCRRRTRSVIHHRTPSAGRPGSSAAQDG